MQLKRLGLGMRFDYLSGAAEREHARQAFEEIFSVLTLSELEGLSLYGGQDPLTEPEENVFLAVIMGGSLTTMRRIYRKISADAAIGMYLAHTDPYIENNRLAAWEGAHFYGTVEKDGTVSGGDDTLCGLTVPKKHGRRKPVGKGIKVLFAPDTFGTLNSETVVKRLAAAARRHFQGVEIVPVPITRGGKGMVRALVTAGRGAYRRAKITPEKPGGARSAVYGVLYGKRAVMSLAEILPGDPSVTSSFNAGEVIRRALDEGLREIIIGTEQSVIRDCGMGCMRALGMKFYDAEGAELKGSLEELSRVAAVDTEYLHPRLRDAKITVVGGGRSETPEEIREYAARFRALVAKAGRLSEKDSVGVGGLLVAYAGAKRVDGVSALFDAVEFNKLLHGVALAVTGGLCAEGQPLDEEHPAREVLKRCLNRRVPAVLLAGHAAEAGNETHPADGGSIAFLDIPFMDGASADILEARFDAAADRLFRLIRLGRDVEKIGAPKPPKEKSLGELTRESLQRRS
ncbi:MAG: glycerate kinase [Clostridiales bacterium]|nr:glycerate kinase [Clostridiales bacterium]